MIKKLALFVIILLLATPVVAQVQQPKDTLVIATSTGFQPFTFLNAEGKPAGMFVDIWRLWSQKTGKQIEFISSNWNTSLENLKNQKADIHSGLLYPRPEHLDWMSGSQPFYEVGVTLFYPVKQGKLSDIKELSGQTVAANRGSHPELFLKENYPSIRVLACDTREELAKVSQEGKSKAFIIILPVGKSVIDRLGLSGEFETYEKILYREKFHAGVLKENTELLALIDKGFNAMSHQELAEIEARWMPDPAKQYYKTSNIIQLTPTEEAWLTNHKTIRLGISPVMPPLKFFEKGVIKGIEPDYINLLSEYTGINFQLVVCDFKDMDTKAKSGETDMFLSVYVPERFTHMMLTKPFMDFDQIIVTRSDAPFMSGLGSLKGKKVAVLRGVKLHEKILAPYPELETVRVDTMEQMFKAVSESKADALISKIYLAAYVMHQYPNLKIAGIADIPRDPYYYAVRKDYPELVSILNKAIESIPNDRVNAIVQKWFSVRVEYRPNWSEILKWAFAIGSAFTLILGLSLFWNKRLVREIDKRKQTEEALRESERMLNATGKMAKIGGWEFDVETLQQTWTEAVYRIHEVDFSFSPDVEKGISFYHPESGPHIEKAVQRAIDHGEPFDIELRFITAKGNHRWVRAKGEATQKQGQTLKVFGTFQDITERKQAEEALREREERERLERDRLELILKTAQDSFWLVDASTGLLVEINEASSSMLGYTREELLTRGLTDIDAQWSPEEIGREMQKVKIAGHALFETRHRAKGGQIIDVEVSVNYLPVTDQFFSFIRNITARKQVEEQVKASLKEKVVLLQEIHHRVKNNMQVIISLLKLQSDKIKDKQYVDMFNDSQNRIRSMALIHEQLYQTKNFADIDFGEYVKSFANGLFVSYGVDTNKISLNIDIKDVSIDLQNAIPCGLIINELVSNSLKHAFPNEREGNINISLHSTGENELDLIISDDGVGIPEDLDIEQTDTMGLHLVKVLAGHQLNGKIDLDRTEGTQFNIKFKRTAYKPRI